MLRNDHTALIDQLPCLFLFLRIIAPAACITNPHCRFRRHAAHTQQESRISRNNLCACICPDISYQCVPRQQRSVIQELPQLHTGSNTAHIACLVYFSVKGMIVFCCAVQADCRHGNLAELYVREFPGQCHRNIRIQVDKDNPDTFPDQIPYRLF